jgi:hypothetical protein
MREEGYWPQLLIALGLFILLLPCVSAANISPGRTELNYSAANSAQKFTFYAVNINSQQKTVELIAEGELAQYVIFEKTELILAPNSYVPFNFTLNLPTDLPPGNHSVNIGVMESSSTSGTGLGAQSIAASQINVENSYKGGVIIANLTASNVKTISQPVVFTTDLTNPTTFDVSNITGTITVFGISNETVQVLQLGTTHLPAGNKTKLVAQWVANNATIGSYKAVANITYSGSSTQSETNFQIGEPSIELLNITVTSGDISKFTAKVHNNWNEEFTDVYASFKISETGGPLIEEIKTLTTNLAPNQTVELTAYWQGTYDSTRQDIEIIIHFAGLQNSETIKATPAKSQIVGQVTTAKVEESVPISYLIISALVLMVVVMVVQYFRAPRRPDARQWPYRQQYSQYYGRYYR